MAQFMLFGFIGVFAIAGLAPVGYALWSVATELPAIIAECLSVLSHGSGKKGDTFDFEKTTVGTEVFFCKRKMCNGQCLIEISLFSDIFLFE